MNYFVPVLKELSQGILSYFGRVQICHKIEKVYKDKKRHERASNNKSQRTKDGQGWRRSWTQSANDEVHEFRLNFPRCPNRDLRFIIHYLQLLQFRKVSKYFVR